MKTTLLLICAAIALSCSSNSDSCQCNLYNIATNEDGEQELRLVNSKDGPCTEEDEQHHAMAQTANCVDY